MIQDLTASKTVICRRLPKAVTRHLDFTHHVEQQQSQQQFEL